MTLPPGLEERARDMLRAHDAQENVRRQQQGHGKPIIAVEFADHRFVAVANTMHYGKNWLVFPDFLEYFLKRAFGLEWGKREQPRGLHPLFRWLAKTQRYRQGIASDGKLKTAPIVSFYACWLRLAYALYLIEHNDVLPKPLIRRLRNVTPFLPAYYETMVGAALAVSGFELSCAETRSTSSPTPEFRATSKTSGTTYEVEAKRKDVWKASTVDLESPEFVRELESWLRDQIHKSSKKKLTNAIYCFELSIPTIETESAWRIVAEKSQAIIRHAEASLTVDGGPVGPAFVFVTNHTFLVNEDGPGAPVFGFLSTIKISDYPMGATLPIDDALAGYDKYRDIFWLSDAWSIAQVVPTTFDGSPPELLTADGEPQPTVKVGDMLSVPDEDGNQIVMRVEDVVSMGDKAAVVVHDAATGKRSIATFPLTDRELQAAARYTDAVFGNSAARRRLRETDPFDLYDFFLQSYGQITREQADNLVAQTPSLQHLKDLPLPELRVQLARAYTKSMWIRHARGTRGPNGGSNNFRLDNIC